MTQPIPFYANTKDNLHCYQAVLKMILKFFEPKKSFTWKQLDQLTARVEGKGTWPTQGFINFHRRGYNLIVMEEFNYQSFIDRGEAYLVEKYGPDVAEKQIEYSDISQERKIMQEFVTLFPTTTKLPELSDIKVLLNQGYLIVCNLNYYPLYNKTSYSGHFVLVYDLDDKYIFLHDPGLPPNPHAHIPIKNFLAAWEYPDKSARNLCAYKLKS